MLRNYTTFPTAELLGPLNEVEGHVAPKRLRIKGHRELLETGRRVAVVGARSASPKDREFVLDLVRGLVERGMTVVTGLAAGIEAAAHVAMVRASGRAVVVLAPAVRRSDPGRNAPLRAHTVHEQLVVCPLAPPTEFDPHEDFLQCRTLALLSDATVVVSSDPKLGTSMIGIEALRLGRPVFAYDSTADRTHIALTQNLLFHGAQIMKRDNLVAILDDMPERVRADIHAY